MADISLLSRLLNGVQRNVDLSQNTLVVGSIKVGSSSPTELTKAILDRLVSLQSGADVDATYHTHDGRYFTETELGSSSSSSGSDLIGDDATYANFTPTAATVKGALAGIDAALVTAGGSDFSDADFEVYNDADDTKILKLDASAISAASTRTISMADQDVDLADIYALVDLSGVAAGSANLGTFTGDIIADSSTIKSALQSLETAIESLPDPMEYKGAWDADTNTPELADGIGNNGDVYYVTVAGTVDFGAGAIAFNVGDRVVYSGADSVWQKWDTTDSVVSVNGLTGAVSLTTTNIAEGDNQYFTEERAQDAVISQVITNGVTDKAPSEDAVFDALALKQDASAELDEAETFFAATDITGAEAEQLTDGSNADSLHSHALVKETMVAGEAMALSTIAAVRMAKAADIGFVAGRVYKADKDASSADNFYVIGLARPGVLLAAGDPVVVVKMGLFNAPSHGFTAGAPIFLDAAGALTNTAPSTATQAVVRIGFARDANNIEVQVQVMGVN